MEDLSDWKFKVAAAKMTKDEAILCLRNVAIMHARFWGERNEDISKFLE